MEIDQNIVEAIGKPLLCMGKADRAMPAVQPPEMTAGGALIREVE